MTPVQTPPLSRRGRRLALYLVLAYAGAWLVCSPLWISGEGLRLPYAGVLLLVMMVVPTAAALVTHRVLPDGRSIIAVTGFKPGPLRRWWRYALVAWWGPVVLSLAALALAALLGAYTPDLRHFSGYARVVSARGPLPLPVATVVAITGVQVVFAAFVNAVPAMGEEFGWRGFLRDTLAGRPRWLVVLVTGVVWGLWHAPIILLGYNYPELPRLGGLGAMVVFCTLVSGLLEWLRAASGTVWVTALAHGGINSSAGLALLFSASAAPVHNSSAGLLGWPGWLLLAAAIAVLAAAGLLRPGQPVRTDPAPTASAVDDVQGNPPAVPVHVHVDPQV